MGKYLLILIFILVNVLLINFIQADLKGIVIKSSESTLLLAINISFEEYETIKNHPPAQIQNSDVLGDADYGLVNLKYSNAKCFNPGDQIKVWIKDDILESYPIQGTAKKIIRTRTINRK